jgi:hypothetical protein
MTRSIDGLNAFKKVDFVSALYSREVWIDPEVDAPEIHKNVRSILDGELAKLGARFENNSKGLRVTGDAGTGKSHILSILRRMAHDRGFFFLSRRL